jgi:HD-GYP domain-containing protein (c-di-GMP phosphodiesterase class II)
VQKRSYRKNRLLEWGMDHRERLDISNYLWGKKGHELGTNSRIIMVAGVFVALTEDRPYRKKACPFRRS